MSAQLQRQRRNQIQDRRDRLRNHAQALFRQAQRDGKQYRAAGGKYLSLLSFERDDLIRNSMKTTLATMYVGATRTLLDIYNEQTEAPAVFFEAYGEGFADGFNS